MELVDIARILCEFLEHCRDSDSFDEPLSANTDKGLAVPLSVNDSSGALYEIVRLGC